MDLLWLLGLTLVVIYFIIKRGQDKRKKKEVSHRQSDLHELIKNFSPKSLPTNKKRIISQARKHTENNMLKFVSVDGMAYWVSNNVFFTANINNGAVDLDNAIPVNTESLSKKEIDKLLKILDSLKGGMLNDSGSAGNEGV